MVARRVGLALLGWLGSGLYTVVSSLPLAEGTGELATGAGELAAGVVGVALAEAGGGVIEVTG
ncbi:MAG: hypothetical protein LBG70_05200 [Bifidobacteriaceae bacterium]|nr:hypothetical protein [Bifidobacteriaceae bacterium]